MQGSEFCRQVAALPNGTLWRHNEAGDLPGLGDNIDRTMLEALVEANRGKRGHTFTHKYTTREDRAAIRWANLNGFVIGLSAEGLEAADKLYDMRIGTVVATVASEAPEKQRTPKGRFAIRCPATYNHDVTCARCRLCAVPTRKSIITFPAHGARASLVNAMLPPASLDSSTIRIGQTHSFSRDHREGMGRPPAHEPSEARRP